jgi:hypothetical protein
MYVYIVSSIFKKDDGNYKKYSIAYKSVELALEYVVADMEAQYEGAYVDLMTDAIKQNVAMRGDYFFRYGGNDHYIMIEKMEVHGEQPNNVDNVVIFGLKEEAEPEMSEEEANVKSENVVQEMSDVEVENVAPEMSENKDENVEEEVNVKSENIAPEMSETGNVERISDENVNVEENVSENISTNISDNIDNANVRPDIKSGDMINEPETLPDTETLAEENTIEDVATPQPTSASLGSNVDSPLAPPAASLSKGGRTRSRIRGRKNALRKTKKRAH